MRDAMPWLILTGVCCVWPGLLATAAYMIGARKFPIRVEVRRPAGSKPKTDRRAADPITAAGRFPMPESDNHE